MTPAEFSGLFHHAAALHRVTLAELQEMAVRFPYSSNLRLLLLLKSRLEGHDQEELYLNRCAAASFDRAFVYDLLRRLESEGVTVEKEEEVLELRELEDLALEPILIGVETEGAEPYAADLEYPELTTDNQPEPPAVVAKNTSGDDVVVDFGEGHIPEQQEVHVSPDDSSVNDDEPADSFPDGFAPPEEDAQAITEEPAEPPGTSPPSGLQQRLARIRRLQAKRTVGKGRDVNNIARRSLIAHEEVASETLASLLVRQGQYENAIRMYERLILLNPDKKTIFAGLIKELQEKL